MLEMGKRNSRLKGLTIFLIASPLIFAAISCQYFGDSTVGAKGIVRGQNGDPIEGVNVSLINLNGGGLPRKAITQKDGAYDVIFIGADPAQTKIIFQKDGYEIVEKRFEKEGRINLDITLNPER